MDSLATAREKVAAAVAAGTLSGSASTQIERWLSEPPFTAYRERLLEDIEAGRWKALDDAFYTVLEFGTGGRRGRMYPIGTNVLNERTMAESARGLADYVASRTGAGASLSCVIAYDTRHNSRAFAEICARALVAAGFRVYVVDQPRSTPLLSTAVRHLKCDAGIMITASHNPPSDNGFKCYNRHGGQVVPPDDAGIIACVKAASDRDIPLAGWDESVASGAIQLVGSELDEVYLNDVVGESVSHARDLKIVFTPLHGVGETAVAAALKRAGFASVEVLEAQRAPDGDFPNVPGHVSNPEIPKTLAASIERARETGADLVIASDPDADRIGVAVPVTGDPAGEWTTLSGNQIGALLTAFVIKQTQANGRLHPAHYIITTMVSSEMGPALARREGLGVENDLLVGFKWIAERIDEAGHATFLFGYEESHGYLKGDYARDKDAAVGALLFAELAATVKDRRQTVLEYLDGLYIDVGHYGEHLINKTMEGRSGQERIARLMAAFRATPPLRLGGLDVVEVADYKTHEVRPVSARGTARLLPEPSGDLLIFRLSAPGCRFAVRPSGTEPKIKFYLFARTEAHDATSPAALAAVKAKTASQLDLLARDIERYVKDAVAEATE
jgi:phosphoglucomutase/phosphomannomutase